MAELAIDISKTAVQLVAEKVKGAIKEEEEQWQTVERDLVFITGEFEMMQSFLDTAGGERIRKHVVRTWVRQVRDLSYDVEDCIDFVLGLDPGERSWLLRLLSPLSWPWSKKPRAARPVDVAVADIKLLKARVMDVSERNARYNLIGDGDGDDVSKPAAAAQMADAPPSHSPSPTPTPKSKSGSISDLADVIDWHDVNLRVVSVSRTGVDLGLGAISLIREFYNNNKRVLTSFKNRAWVKLMHPFNPHEFIRNLLAQFLTNSSVQDENAIIGIDVLKQLEQISLVDMFVQEVNTHSYLIVLEDVSSMEQWDAIKTYLPNRRNKSRIIVSTHHDAVARLCTGQPYRVSMLKQPSAYHIFYTDNNDEKGQKKQEQAVDSAGLIGRDEEINEILELIMERRHISVWGSPGIGKTSLMKAVYDIVSDFTSRTWANVSDPFNADGLSRDIASGLSRNNDNKRRVLLRHSNKRQREPLTIQRLLFPEERYLVVIDDLKSKQDWDFINGNVTCNLPPQSCVVVIAANESVAKYCAQGSYSAVYKVKGLDAHTALRLFEEKASFMKDEGNRPADVWHLLSMCSGLPQFIMTLADHVAKKPRIHDRMVAMRILNDNFMREMQKNPKFSSLNGVFAWLHSSFDASPQLLKKCIFYLSVFPRGCIIRRKRLVRRWSAEGFSGATHRTSLEEAEMLIDKLIDLGVLQAIPFPVPSPDVVGGGGGAGADAIRKTSTCQVNSLFLQYIIISRQTEEKTFLPLEVSVLEGSAASSLLSTTQPMGVGRRHLAIRSSWERDEFDFNSMDLSRLRSLTVSGEWQRFLVTEKMRVLRVLDLEGTSRINVHDHSFQQIGFLLPRLKYLSLRGCKEVYSLPESLGELRQLQTLDIRGTSVAKLPPCIVKLRKLQNICAGNNMRLMMGYNYNKAREQLSYWLSRIRRGRPEAPQGSGGVVVPIGIIEKLEALRTLGVVNANGGGEFVLRGVKKLTKLYKLGVSGLGRENSREFWSLISGHRHMESLSVSGGVFPPRHVGFPPSLTKLTLDMPWCVLTPVGLGLLGELERLRTLRLRVRWGAIELSMGPFGHLKVLHLACMHNIIAKFPEGAMKGIEQLTLETEASLRITDGVEQLGKLKRLRSLCLRFHEYRAATQEGIVEPPGPGQLQFGNKDDSLFGQLKVLEVVSKARLLVKFTQGTMKELEQLTLQTDELIRLDGLNHLGKLKRLHSLCLRFAYTEIIQFGGEKQQASSGSTTSSPPDDRFGSLKVLEIACMSSGPRLKFAAGAMRKLVKLTLRTATLLTAKDMKELGKLKKLRTLCLDFDKCQDQEGELRFGEKQKAAGASSSRPIPRGHINIKVPKKNVVGASSSSSLPEDSGKLKALEQNAAGASSSSSTQPEDYGNLKVLEQNPAGASSSSSTPPEDSGNLKVLEQNPAGASSSSSIPPEDSGKLKVLEQNAAGASSLSSTTPEHFGKLKVLEIIYRSELQVKFAENYAMKNLEQLKLHCLIGSSDVCFSWIDHQHLPLLKQIWVRASLPYRNELMPVLKRQLDGHNNRPVVNLDELEPHSS